METTARLGRPQGTFKGDALRDINYTLRISKADQAFLESRRQALKVPLSDIFHGMIQEMRQTAAEIQDPIKVTVRGVPTLMEKAEAKRLLKELTLTLLES